MLIDTFCLQLGFPKEYDYCFLLQQTSRLTGQTGDERIFESKQDFYDNRTLIGGSGENRTLTSLRTLDFESSAFTNHKYFRFRRDLGPIKSRRSIKDRFEEFHELAEKGFMRSKVQEFEVPLSNGKLAVQVWENGSWIAYPYLNGELDTANGITKLSQIPKKIRDGVNLYIKKCQSDFKADKSSAS